MPRQRRAKQVLLYIQAGCWAAVSAVGLLWLPLWLANNDVPLAEEAELFGLLWLFIPAYGFIALGFSGACLLLAAVLCMTRPRARQYFNRPNPLPVNPDQGALSGPASFRPLTLARHRLAVI